MSDLIIKNFTNIETVAFDVDGVILDFHKGFENAALFVLGRNIQAQNKSYDLSVRYNISREERIAIWDYIDNVEMSNFPLIEGAAEVFNFFKNELNVCVPIVTGIYEKSKQKRIENLEKHGIIVDDIYCVGNGISSKRDFLKKLNPQIFFDDRLQHLHESNFIPNRIWINSNDDEQLGYKPNKSLTEVKSINEWFKSNKNILLNINKKNNIKKYTLNF